MGEYHLQKQLHLLRQSLCLRSFALSRDHCFQSFGLSFAALSVAS